MASLFARNVGLLTLSVGMLASCMQPPLSYRVGSVPAIERHQISTVPFNEALGLRTATYTPSGKILVSYAKSKIQDERQLDLAVMNDDGRSMRPLFSGMIPRREKDNGLRFMVFSDNKRIFMGDFILECAESLDTCTSPSLLPVQYPAEVASGPHISHRWSEMIVAPDNRHVAWTTLLSNYSAIVFTGELQKTGANYTIVKPQIISTLDPFQPDPAHVDGVLPTPVLGGEVKQFVHGGTAISLAGAGPRDLPTSVVQHLADGTKEVLTDTPGYTETTILSPDEQLGLTMTTRFSERTDPAILGLIPRPYPDSLNMGLSMLAYTYSVTGVRRGRPGNIGPALIAIGAAKAQDGNVGSSLFTEADWVYDSPMSWHPSSRKAMWIEGRRTGGTRRIRMVTLPNYQPTQSAGAHEFPESIRHSSADLSVVKRFASASRNIAVKVYGKTSGYISYIRTPSSIEKTYVNFSDDGQSVYSGSERMQANPAARSTYTAKLQVAGAQPGSMDLKMTFGPLTGDLPAQLIFAPDNKGTPLTHGYAEFGGRRLDVGELVP